MAFIQQAPRRAAAATSTSSSPSLAATQDRGETSKQAKRTGSQEGHEQRHNLETGEWHDDDAASSSARDWSIVFPGRPAKTPQEHLDLLLSERHDARQTSSAATPFLDTDEVESIAYDAPLVTPLPPLHDGTGRFTAQVSPSESGQEHSSETGTSSPILHRTSSTSPHDAGLRFPPSEALTRDGLSGSEELDVHDGASSIASPDELFSETESEVRERISRRNRRASSAARRASGVRGTRSTSVAAPSDSAYPSVPPASMRPGSASWAWMHAPQHQRRLRRQKSELSVVLTSDSEGEEANVERQLPAATTNYSGGIFGSAHIVDHDEAAFEEALGNTHAAQSAGLRSRLGRVPKRRHRRNGESEKGSKRSNTSAALASDLRSSLAASAALRERRQAQSARRSATSAASARVRQRQQQQQKPKSRAREVPREKSTASIDSGAQGGTMPLPSSRGQRFLHTVLRRVFGVDDDEVLAAFLQDEGPLRIDGASGQSSLPTSSAVLATHASRGTFDVRADTDDVWTRNRRNRHMRLLFAGESADGLDAGAESDQDYEAAGDDNNARHLTKGTASTGYRPPHRVHVSSNVAEPSLREALQASVLSGLRVLPSGLSMLMAGSHSMKLVNFLVGRIGPGLTERVRKMLEEEQDSGSSAASTTLGDALDSTATESNTTATNARTRSATLLSDASTRFSGAAHPVLANGASPRSRSNVVV